MAEQVALDEIPKLKVTELKKLLKEKGLPVSGTKTELVERLTQSLSTADDVLAENVDPVTKPVVKKEFEKQPAAEVSAPTNSVKTSAPVVKTEEGKKVVDVKAVGGLTEAERMKRRAERFGMVSADAKKQARAERFGLTTSTTAAAGASGTNLDVLKKRAERFGEVTSKSLAQLEEKERIRKRKERFGEVTASSGGTKKIVLNEIDEKKRKRAERFGLL